MNVIEGGNGGTGGPVNEDPIDKALREAETEITKEFSDKAKNRIKGSLRRIADAKKIVANLELEHEALLRDLRNEAAA